MSCVHYSHSICDCCGGPLFGSGLQVVRPVSHIFGVKNLPFLFRSCSPQCKQHFMSNTDTLMELLYGENQISQEYRQIFTWNCYMGKIRSGSSTNRYSHGTAIWGKLDQPAVQTNFLMELLYGENKIRLEYRQIFTWNCYMGKIRSASSTQVFSLNFCKGKIRLPRSTHTLMQLLYVKDYNHFRGTSGMGKIKPAKSMNTWNSNSCEHKGQSCQK